MCSIFIGPLFSGEPRPWPSGPEMSPFTRARASVSQQRPWVRCASPVFFSSKKLYLCGHTISGSWRVSKEGREPSSASQRLKPCAW